MQPYNKPLKCFPVVMMPGKERTDLDRGGKSIIKLHFYLYISSKNLIRMDAA
jgi:hypothetical protein